MRTILLAIFTIFSPFVFSQEKVKDYTSSDLNVFEAVFRHLFDNNASGAQRNVGYFFLQIEGRDASESFVSRFKDDTVDVLSASLSTYDKMKGVRHIRDGKRGLIFKVIEFEKKTKRSTKSLEAILKRG